MAQRTMVAIDIRMWRMKPKPALTFEREANAKICHRRAIALMTSVAAKKPRLKIAPSEKQNARIEKTNESSANRRNAIASPTSAKAIRSIALADSRENDKDANFIKKLRNASSVVAATIPPKIMRFFATAAFGSTAFCTNSTIWPPQLGQNAASFFATLPHWMH